jgi:hypothetical protein
MLNQSQERKNKIITQILYIVMKNELFKIRNLVRILTPLYISICAALLLDLKSNINLDCGSFLSFVGLISFGIACVISNKLYNRCNACDRVYDIKMDTYYKNPDKKKEMPDLKSIYEERENRQDEKGKYMHPHKRFEYNGFWVFGILGLLFVIFSYVFSEKNPQQVDNQDKILQRQIDSLEVLNIKYEEQILELKIENDSIKNNLLNCENDKVQNTVLVLKSDMIKRVKY